CNFETEPTTVAGMRTFIKISTLFLALLVTMSLHVAAATPEQEKAFTDKYKKAFEAKDMATLQSFLYTQGADPAIVGFYKMMQSGEAGRSEEHTSELQSLAYL